MDQETRAQAFLHQHAHAALASVDRSGLPLSSAVNVVPDGQGRLVVLLSNLAEHTANIRQQPAVSLMWVEATHSDWQAAQRLTVTGRLAPVPEASGERFLQVFPHMRDYLQMDFHFFALRPEKARWIPGFGKAAWLRGDALLPSHGWDPARELEMVGHMNADHRDACDHYLGLLGCPGTGAQMLALDPWGCWLLHDGQLRRLPFPNRAEDAMQVREALVTLARTQA
ncbi:MAG: pyridoxamine 5'-phosphate oxidase family protein [Alcanivorax sp.]|nr:pyridoxamine 5'-phosphate oxidase family protein [Alcanivorax sp.]